MKIFIKKLAWEFWPTWLMYLPMVVLWPYFMLGTGKVRFWNFVNPGMQNGGLIGDSKIASLSQLPTKNIPKQFAVKSTIDHKKLLSEMYNHKIKYPCIVKPDNGMRGKGVKKIDSDKELEIYFKNIQKQTFLGKFQWVENFLLKFNKKTNYEVIIIQDFISMDKEFGVFYIKKLNDESGKIVSLMERRFPIIIGNGVNTLQELILKDERASLYKRKYFKRYNNKLKTVLDDSEIFQLGSIGSHNLGTVFIDKTHYISGNLTDTFDCLSKNISGFYYGRYDVKANSIEELEKGNFQVLEINGLNAEPVHMYDSKIKPWQGWAIIIKFWFQAFQIAMQNKELTKHK